MFLAFYHLVFLLPILLLAACAGLALYQRPVTLDYILQDPGTFNLIRYGRENLQDVETLAILDKTGDAYEFKPLAPTFQYLVSPGLPARQALAMADEFLRALTITGTTHAYAIPGPASEVVGYEIRPDFPEIPVAWRKLSTTYLLLEGNIIQVTITWLDPAKPFFNDRRR